MPRLGHGQPITDGDIDQAKTELAEFAARSPLAFALAPPVSTQPFDLLFPMLQDDEANLLPQSPSTNAQLKRLGATMLDDTEEENADDDSPIPAAYTYLGQFIDHDITLEIEDEKRGLGSAKMEVLLDDGMLPLTLEEMHRVLRNQRSATLDLDSLYSPPQQFDPDDSDKLRVGKVHNIPLQNPPNPNPPPTARPEGKGDDNDVHREGRDLTDKKHDRAALIGDPRNDENTIISQLHVAFLKAHNVLVDQGLSYGEARRTLRQHYQYIVIEDFLTRVADKEIVRGILANGNRWYNPYAAPFYMPLEFAVAAYRFGHSMIRGVYNFNSNFRVDTQPPGSLDLLFVFTALSGQLGEEIRLGPAETLPENWIIEWENIIGSGDDVMTTRKIDTKLAAFGLNNPRGGGALFNLKDTGGTPLVPADASRLAVRNLLRGYRLRLPTGQAVAHLIGAEELTKDQIRAAAGSDAQRAVLDDSEFLTRTPLWYYVLAEAKALHEGAHLGPVGSTIVAEVLIGLALRSDDSYLRTAGWRPTLPSQKPGHFELADLLRLAGVLPGGEQPRTYKVRPGDSLGRIAREQLGDEARWPEIFVLNRATIQNPDRIFPGQVLFLPPAQPTGPIPKLYTVKPGDSLSKIARERLGNESRWRDIWNLNRDIVPDPDRIFPGQVLVLPNS
ncbi:LysM peptidoglycan-binding domain-containing protein [Actinoplanes hulinensis]|uniref:LysM peptidoglycan-binding domain-containing protein n=1 Tax=Actinoplanes hulinensis TaxID=1144547 RepID=A0ABS7B902_9ACTN|nr:LysM peptidoglycan-binding domain-containing protein [Actinoplanes hulinensis]MBW6437392.1 LysM peptidoglycan-binding domain-containing protein [Actinoplanes hulinensis]